MGWIIIGKLFLKGLTLYISLDLFKGMLRLQRKYGLSFRVEDLAQLKDWFIYYLPFTNLKVRWFSIGWFGMFIGLYNIDWVLKYYFGIGFWMDLSLF